MFVGEDSKNGYFAIILSFRYKNNTQPELHTTPLELETPFVIHSYLYTTLTGLKIYSIILFFFILAFLFFNSYRVVFIYICFMRSTARKKPKLILESEK
jgi:hypothetical protein